MEYVILALVLFVVVRNFRNDKADKRPPVGGGAQPSPRPRPDQPTRLDP